MSQPSLSLAETRSTHDDLSALLSRQKQAFSAHPMPTLAQRLDKLARLHRGIISHREALTRALSQDFGHRSEFDSVIADILPCINQLRYTRRRLKRWMKPDSRHAGMLLAPAKIRVEYQPLGVVGIMVPWNFPVFLALAPLLTALAAGNRAMIKLSEFTPATNAVLKTLLSEQFDPEEVAVVEGEAERSAAFSRLPFDHLFFTGSTAVGRHVMRAAAENLVPVTLELGGKSPTLIGPDMSMEEAVERIAWGKCMNAGQICVAPDYILLPEGQQQNFIDAFRRRFTRLYPKGLASPDYTSVVNTAQYRRLLDTLEDAVDKGAIATPLCNPARDDEQHRLALHLLTNVDDQMRVMQEEIFGPLLPLVPYRDIDQALAYVQARPRPLALYLMSHDAELQQRVQAETHAGGMAINETLLQVAADDAPFGGVGPSGMGEYHGEEGFRTFSKAKTILQRGRFNPATLIHPPYRTWLHRLMVKLLVR
ncbi:coniferyl aldehyde dehydrogenase [Ferrimonas gelatinilytica]|uniref:Aldehyde dehydrogenase n=1 Tax=Ferrimonas gelatinilytica TaxID=1255257 RepID=A0ABP9S9V7_9GAMM